MQMAQRTAANKAASPVQRSALLPARPRSVIARFKDNDRPDEVVKNQAQKLADQADKAWVGVDKNIQRTDNGPAPVSELPAQDVDTFLKRAGGKPLFDEGEPKVGPWASAFTRRREIFMGRIAMIGLPAAAFWEYVLPNHPNITEQVSYGLQLAGLDNATSATGATLIGLIVLQNVISAFAPWSATFSQENLRDVAKRPQGPPSQFPSNIGGWLGIAELGAFSKANELFNGRLAMLGFAAAVLQQLRLGGVYGPGPVAQVAEFLNTSPETFYANIPVIFAAWGIFWTTLAFARGKLGSIDQEMEIY